MCQLLNDDFYQKIISSNDEDYIFDNFFPTLPIAIKLYQNNSDNTLIIIRRVFSILDKILKMFFISDDINELPDSRKNEILNISSCTELIVSKLSNDNVNLEDKELVDSIQLVFEFFNKINDDQKKLSETMSNLNNNLEKGTKELEENLVLTKISNYCKENFDKSKNDLDLDELDNYMNIIVTMINNFNQDIIKDTMENLVAPESSIENVNKMKAYNMISMLKILLHIKNK